MMRYVVKSLAESLASGLVSMQVRGASARRGRLVLVWHNVLPPGESAVGEHSLHMDWEAFVGQLDAVQELADVLPLNALLDGKTPFVGTRPQVALTFDDAYAGAVEYALPEIARRGLPSTTFVPPAFLDGRSFWWDEIAMHTGGALSAELRYHLVDVHHGDYERIRGEAARIGLQLGAPPAHALGASTGAVYRARELPGVALGVHSWSHPNLARVNAERLRHELVRSLDWIIASGEQAPFAASYPYGRTSAEVGRQVDHAGIQFGLLVEGGWMGSSAETFALPRFNIPSGLSVRGLRARLAGVWPIG